MPAGADVPPYGPIVPLLGAFDESGLAVTGVTSALGRVEVAALEVGIAVIPGSAEEPQAATRPAARKALTRSGSLLLTRFTRRERAWSYSRLVTSRKYEPPPPR